jgi:hypothetical protein
MTTMRFVRILVLGMVLCAGRVHAQAAALTNESSSGSSSESVLVKAIQGLVQGGIRDDEQQQLHTLIDSLRAVRCDEVLSKNMMVWGHREGECLWGDGSLSTLNLANVTANTEGGSIYTDVLTTYFGPVRMGVGTLLAATQQNGDEDEPGPDEVHDEREALQRLVGGGGNLLIGAQYPFLFLPYAKWNEFKLTGAVLGRAATDVGALGADPESRSSSVAGAVDLRLQFTSNDSEVAIFGYARGEMIRGDGTLFSVPRRAAGDTTASATPVQQLDYLQYALGARLWNSVLITWTKFDCRACRTLGMDSQLSITAQRTAP